MKCPICGSEEFTKIDSLIGENKNISWQACKSCGYILAFASKKYLESQIETKSLEQQLEEIDNERFMVKHQMTLLDLEIGKLIREMNRASTSPERVRELRIELETMDAKNNALHERFRELSRKRNELKEQLNK